MPNFFKKTFSLLKNLFKGNLKYAFGQFKLTSALYTFIIHIFNSSYKKQSDKAAVFFLEDGKKDRYIFSIINAYRISGYDIFLKPKYSFFSSCKGLYIFHIFTFLKIKTFFLKNKINKYSYKVFITDIVKYKQQKGYNKYITIDYKLAFKNYKLTLPFPFHPLVYDGNNLRSIKDVERFLASKRNNKRKIKIIFGGQVFHKSYNKINNNFEELINRNDMFNFIYERFSSKISNTVSVKNETLQEIVITHRETNNIEHKNWMEILSSASFFISPPGFEMPFSHNVIEAMACGVIPILQYNKYFTPNLIHNVNCLAYSNIKELEYCINFALNMRKDQIKKMRMNTILYYSNHLTPQSFIKKVEEERKKQVIISIISGEYSLPKN